MAAIKLSVVGQQQLEHLGKRLKDAGDKGLTSELKKGIKRAADPAKREVQRVVRTLPVRSTRGGGKAARLRHQRARRPNAKRLRGAGLRESIARSVKIQATTGGNASVRIRQSVSELPHDQRKLPRYMDSVKGWLHPTFGRRANPQDWQHQVAKPWFGETLKKQVPPIRRQVLRAMNDVAGKIAKG